MSGSKQDLAKEVKLIRQQLYELSLECKEKDAKITELTRILKPYFKVLSPRMYDEIVELMGEDDQSG